MKFEQLLRKVISAKSFCVVGNAPNEFGKHKGKLIDSFETVIRFNDFSLEFSQDYGKKVDIWVRAAIDEVIETLEEKNKESFRIIFYRNIGKKNKKSVNYLEKHNKKFLAFPASYERDLSKILHSPPSTGLLFLYILKENGFRLKNNVFGFAFFDKATLEKYGNHHYYNIKSQKKSVGIDLAKHNWAVEKKFFNSYILEK